MDVWLSMIISNPTDYKQCYNCRAISIKEKKNCHGCNAKRFTKVTKEKLKNLKHMKECNGDKQIEVS